MEKLDANADLLGFEDGVYDLRSHQFRDGRPDDFVSFSTKLYYYPEDGEEPYSENHPKVKEVREFMSQILPNPEVRDYVLTLFASFLCGSTADEKFHIWTGSGGNGKSKLVELYQNCLGDYATTLPITLLTGKRSGANNASPELAKTRGKRFASLQEPEEDSQIQVGLMKELTGGDTISARGLYEAASEFKPQFKMVLTCNHLPKIPSDDGGTWRRIRVVEFTSKFVDHPMKPNEFKRDYHLNDKMEHWKEPFLWILLERYRVYQQGSDTMKAGLHEPEQVLKYTHSYRLNNNIFVEFLDEVLVDDEEGFITVSDLYSEFKEWFRESHNLKPPPKKDFLMEWNGNLDHKKQCLLIMNNRQTANKLAKNVNVEQEKWDGKDLPYKEKICLI